MHGGDFVTDGKFRQYQGFLKTLDGKTSLPFLTTIGNHELIRPQKEHRTTFYDQAFGPLNYFFDYKGFRFVAVDTSDYNITQEELSWLQEVLNTPLRKIVFTHTPPKQLSTWTKFLWIEGGFEYGGENFLQLMSERRVERVYVGHMHGFGVTDYKGVRYVLTAGAGSPLYPWKPIRHKIYNFVEVRVTDSGELLEYVHFIDPEGRLAVRPIADFKPGQGL